MKNDSSMYDVLNLCALLFVCALLAWLFLVLVFGLGDDLVELLEAVRFIVNQGLAK